MAHKTIFNKEIGIVETKLDGVITFNEVRNVISESTALAKEYKCYLWLTDYCEATSQLSTMEIYDLPKLFSEAASLLNINVFQIKRAIVISKDKANYHFAQNVSKNRGQSLELFDDIEKARNWLKSINVA